MFFFGRYKVDRIIGSMSDVIGYVQVIKGKLLRVYECYYFKGFFELYIVMLIFFVFEVGD